MTCGTAHSWTWSGTNMPNETPCDCGMMKWKPNAQYSLALSDYQKLMEELAQVRRERDAYRKIGLERIGHLPMQCVANCSCEANTDAQARRIIDGDK